jgi:M6 family metalloprotease-like protein
MRNVAVLVVFRVLCVFFSFSTPTLVKAGPAYPYPIVFKQPDGSKLTILLKGDETVNWGETIDGYSILFNSNGTYEYAIADDSFSIMPSGVQARNKADRTDVDNKLLAKTAKALRYSPRQVEIMRKTRPIYKTKSNANQNTQGAQSFPTTGNRKMLCVLIESSDLAFTKTQANFDNLFNQLNYSIIGDYGPMVIGSVKDYYLENSYGQLSLTTTVVGPYKASKSMAYYGAGNLASSPVRELIREAMILADKDINFADFDNDNDGVVDGVYVVYAGMAEGSGGGYNAIWPHFWEISPLLLDGKTIINYACSSELNSDANTSLVGIIAHEMGHSLGASDYYDTDLTTNGLFNGTAQWDVMANGVWNNYGYTPASHNPYTKTVTYGWANATTLTTSGKVTINNSTKNSTGFYRINTATPNEYFLLENKQAIGFDAAVPGHGLLIYHVDEDYIKSHSEYNYINTTSHQGLYPICAYLPSKVVTQFGALDSDATPFPGTISSGYPINRSFTDDTAPNSLSWAGQKTAQPITNITENETNGTISFNYVNNSTGIGSIAANQWNVFPNPVSDYLTIEVAGNTKELGVDIINSIGQTVIKANVVEQKQLNITGLTPGVYFVRVKNAAHSECKKITKL